MAEDSESEIILRLGEEMKMIAAPPHWYYDSHDLTKLRLSVPLAVGLVTVQSLYLDCHCRSDDPEVDVTVQLSYKPVVGNSGALSRLDRNPLHTHGNAGLIKGEWAYKDFSVAHLRPFSEKFGLGLDRMLAGNLPIAFPVSNSLKNLRDMLQCAGDNFRIADIQRVPEPRWTRRLV